jgi:hypothetical protein
MQHQRGNNNNYMPINNRHNNNMGNYGGQGVKRMRGDDPRNDNESASHRMKWNTLDDDNNMTFLERNDIDQRSEYDLRSYISLIRFIFL